MFRYSTALIASTAMLFITGLSPVHAQYQGPGAYVETNLERILNAPQDDQQVQLEGFLVNKIRGDKYTFSDGKQTIRIEIDSDAFPSEPFNEKTRIQIHGEVEKDFMETPEIDVDRIQILR
ncbi:MAG: NirD/YgiW/YdeI family stress tolerance protein [Thiotrichales bacterium]|nr:NirD/YgiW/YdeI family stress tolerance protein [Thiotrichales bacterium]